MPIVQHLMDSLVERYGQEKGRHVYYAMEAEGTGPFALGAKYHSLHEQFAKRAGVAPIDTPKPSKVRHPRKARRARA
jgi:hypothetical protein